jgi:branched-subunit amino acid aminotransferase/4-amino-4-deoxychorismate lyase
MTAIGDVLIDGQAVDAAVASVSVFDTAILRGFGCFESLRSYGGVAFRQRQHLDRLERSAGALGLRLPERDDMDGWVADRASIGDCGVKVVATGGTGEPGPRGGSRFIVFAEPLPEVDATVSLLPVAAPWHPDGATSELTGAKTLSYGPNLAARRRAHDEGYGDALLIGRSGHVLEGPTNTIAWVIDGVVETPELGLGILASVTREAVIDVAAEIGVEVREGRFPLARIVGADEAMSLSTFREVQPVTRIGASPKPVGPITQRLANGFHALVARETSGHA